MERYQFLTCQETEPEEKWHGRFLEVFRQTSRCLQIRILNHVGGVDPPVQTRVQSQCHHATKPRPALFQDGAEARRIVQILGHWQRLSLDGFRAHLAPPRKVTALADENLTEKKSIVNLVDCNSESGTFHVFPAEQIRQQRDRRCTSEKIE